MENKYMRRNSPALNVNHRENGLRLVNNKWHVQECNEKREKLNIYRKIVHFKMNSIQNGSFKQFVFRFIDTHKSQTIKQNKQKGQMK